MRICKLLTCLAALVSNTSLNGSDSKSATRAISNTQAFSTGYSARFDTGSESILSVHGDSWTAAWCDDDRQYVTSDDSKNVDGSCISPKTSKGYNITFGELTSSGPAAGLSGFKISCMPSYGIENETLASAYSSNSCRATWKANGAMCIDSTLYMGLSRHVYAWDGFGNAGNLCYADRQKTFDGSIIRSTNGGVDWGTYPGLNAAGPGVQFPGSSFGTPSFIQYGKGMNDWLPSDGAREYVYAISNDGSWDNGSQLFLARALRSSNLTVKANWNYLSNVSPQSWSSLPAIVNSNPGFELVDGSGAATGWPTYGGAKIVSNDVTAGNRTHWGGRSLALYGPADGTYRRINGLTAGSAYYLSSYLRVTNPNESVMVGVQNYGGPTAKAKSISRDWSQRVVRFVPAGSSADIFCWKANGTQAAFCDDMQVTRQPPPAAVLEAPGHLSTTQIQYLPPSNGAPGFYLLPEWYYPNPNAICTSRWAFYIAEAPWGPWTKLDIGDDGPDGKEKEWSDCSARTKGYYNPTVVPKWIGAYDQASHTRDVWILYAGDFSLEVAYKPHLMRMVVSYPTSTRNLLQNGSFEDGAAAWWKSSTAAVVIGHAYTGRGAARLSKNDGFLQRILGLVPGSRYQLSGHLEVTSTGDEARIGVKDYGGPELSASGTSQTYKQAIIDFIPTSTSATVYCWKWTGSLYAYCDAIQVSKP